MLCQISFGKDDDELNSVIKAVVSQEEAKKSKQGIDIMAAARPIVADRNGSPVFNAMAPSFGEKINNGLQQAISRTSPFKEH